MNLNENSSIAPFNKAAFDAIVASIKDILRSSLPGEEITVAWQSILSALKDQDMSLVLYSFRVFLLAAAVAGVNKTTLEELEETTGNLRKAWVELSDSSRVSVFIYLQPILLQIYLENLRA